MLPEDFLFLLIENHCGAVVLNRYVLVRECTPAACALGIKKLRIKDPEF